MPSICPSSESDETKPELSFLPAVRALCGTISFCDSKTPCEQKHVQTQTFCPHVDVPRSHMAQVVPSMKRISSSGHLLSFDPHTTPTLCSLHCHHPFHLHFPALAQRFQPRTCARGDGEPKMVGDKMVDKTVIDIFNPIDLQSTERDGTEQTHVG